MTDEVTKVATPRPRGRPRLAAQRGIVVNVSLPRELVERLRVAGNGSVSRGILRLISGDATP